MIAKQKETKKTKDKEPKEKTFTKAFDITSYEEPVRPQVRPEMLYSIKEFHVLVTIWEYFGNAHKI